MTGRALLLGFLVMAGAGCASREAATTTKAYDPFEPVNRVVYRVNDLGDRYLLRPAAVGYTRGTPRQFRSGIRNAFSNLRYPITIVNALLQGKFAQAGHDSGRFLLNSTVGLGGFLDPATRIGLGENDEDFDQTMAVWGLAQGPYLVIPLLGPRTTRHAFSELVDAPLSPFVSIANGELSVSLGLWLIYQVDGRSRLLDADQQVFEAFDPYLFVRDAYYQHRQYRALDGDVPEDDSYLDDPEFDDEAAED
ncbi:MAG: VacJ family lipoprotein [Gammaproteobacteria bacterium]|nr:VacJ family lipoprotein [Gammaproteobacteria bacterium]MDH5277219.1 VacJ family lipoprotein [Gammaproteobacteria bacterium]